MVFDKSLRVGSVIVSGAGFNGNFAGCAVLASRTMEYHDASRSSAEKTGEHSGAPRTSAVTMSHEIAPKYKNDPEIETDMEKGNVPKLRNSSSDDLPPHKLASSEELKNQEELDDEPGLIKRYWRRYRPIGHATIWTLITAYKPLKGGLEVNCRWWICGLVLHRDKWLIPSLLYIAICLWFFTCYVPVRYITKSPPSH